MEAHHELHVLAERLPWRAHRCAQEVAAEDAEGTGDDEQAVQPRPRDPAAEKAAQVLAGLARLDAGMRDARTGDDVVLDHGAVRDPDRAADRDHVVRVGGEDLDDSFQRVRFEERVGIDDRHELVAGDIETRVDRVGAASVRLPHDP